MQRREFSTNLLAAMLAGSAPALANPRPSPEAPPKAPYKISVMLWTVFNSLPFEQRLEKVAEAGYTNVELVGEYRKWSEGEFSSYNAKRKQLGIQFDVTAGLTNAIGNPQEREGLLRDVRTELPIMERLECPAVIVMSGDVVPGTPRRIQHESCIEG